MPNFNKFIENFSSFGALPREPPIIAYPYYIPYFTIVPAKNLKNFWKVSFIH